MSTEAYETLNPVLSLLLMVLSLALGIFPALLQIGLLAI